MDAQQQETGLIALAIAIVTGLLASLAKDAAFWRFVFGVPRRLWGWIHRPRPLAMLTEAFTANTAEIKLIRTTLEHGFAQANGQIANVINQQAINAATVAPGTYISLYTWD